VITRRWTLSDNCGFSTSCDQTITLLSPGGQDGTFRLDVMPGRCPNVVTATSQSVKITIPGTWNRSVNAIVPQSLVVKRADGAGIELTLAHHDFVVTYGDVSRPYYYQDGPCQVLGETGADHHPDLTMTMNTAFARRALQLKAVPDDTMVPVVVTGRMTNGETFSLTDWFLVRN